MKALIFGLYFLLNFSIAASKGPKITFISPDPINTNNEFWIITNKEIIKAAKDLNINLEVLYSRSHYSFYLEKVTEVIKRPPESRPDYLMILPIKRSTQQILQQLETAKIKTLFINAQINEKELQATGIPRDLYKNWIGHFYPDDTQAAALAANEVYKACGKNAEIVAINGSHTSNASLAREKSYINVSKSLSLNLKQSFYGNWKKTSVSKMLPFIEMRYPNLCGFLVSSDLMAEAIVDQKKKSYKVCSIDWTSNGLQHVINGEQLCTVGGHFFEPAFALVTLFDYHMGIDFKEDFGLIYKTPFYIANKKNAQKIYTKFIMNKNTINYRNYSKFYNKKLKKYNFDIFKKL